MQIGETLSVRTLFRLQLHFPCRIQPFFNTVLRKVPLKKEAFT
jgi:hypothetical protein